MFIGTARSRGIFPLRGGVQKPQGKWKEISAEIDAVGTTVKEKRNTWNKSCRERIGIVQDG